MLSTIIDWFEFTVFDTDLKTAIEQVLQLPFSDFEPLPKGRYGYSHQIKWKNGHVFVMFSTSDSEITETSKIKEETGIHVMLTGQGCRHYSTKQNILTLISTLEALEKVNYSRVDLAIDDFESKVISYDRINKAALQGHFTSRWSKWDEIISRQAATSKFLGRTMYFGSQSSELFCRIYDKSLERKANSEEKDIPEHWTRLELVYRKERAKKLIEHLLKRKNVGEALKGTLKHYIRFLKPSTTDKNKARWKTADWWEKLLYDVEALQLTIKKDTKSIEDMATWVERQISPTVAAILQAQGGDMSWLRKIIIKGSSRLSQRHKDAINLYQKAELT